MFKLMIFAVVLTSSTQALSKDWPETQGWVVGEIGENRCAIQMTYEGKGESKLTFVKDLDGNNYFLLDNYSWSAENKKMYNIAFVIDGNPLVEPRYAMGNVIGIRKGFIQKIGQRTVDLFIKGSSLRVYMFPETAGKENSQDDNDGEPVLIDQLSLTGSGAAAIQMERCLSHIKKVADAARREKEKYDHLPDDPFK